TLSGHQKRIKMFIIDSKTGDIFTYAQDGLLKRFTKDGQLRFSVVAQEEDAYPAYLKPLSLTPDGKTVITGSTDFQVKLWDAENGHQRFSVQNVQGVVRSISSSPKGQQFVIASDEPAVQVWNMTTGAITRLLQGHSGGVWSASYSADGTQLLTTSTDTTARLWSVSWGWPILTFSGHV